jgi:hypothetical protein
MSGDIPGSKRLVSGLQSVDFKTLYPPPEFLNFPPRHYHLMRDPKSSSGQETVADVKRRRETSTAAPSPTTPNLPTHHID